MSKNSSGVLRQSAYSDNLVCVILSYYHFYKTFNMDFINIFVRKQFQDIDFDKLKFKK